MIKALHTSHRIDGRSFFQRQFVGDGDAWTHFYFTYLEISFGQFHSVIRIINGRHQAKLVDVTIQMTLRSTKLSRRRSLLNTSQNSECVYHSAIRIPMKLANEIRRINAEFRFSFFTFQFLFQRKSKIEPKFRFSVLIQTRI